MKLSKSRILRIVASPFKEGNSKQNGGIVRMCDRPRVYSAEDKEWGQGRIAELTIELESLRRELLAASVVAPKSGLIYSLQVTQGSYVNRGQLLAESSNPVNSGFAPMRTGSKEHRVQSRREPRSGIGTNRHNSETVKWELVTPYEIEILHDINDGDSVVLNPAEVRDE